MNNWKKTKAMKVKYPLTLQYAGTILGLTVGTMLLCWFLNNTFLEDYYTYKKLEAMQMGFSAIDAESAKGTLESNSFGTKFDKICENDNLSVLIFRPNNEKIWSSARDEIELLDQYWDVYMYSVKNPDKKLLKKTGKYRLIHWIDNRHGSEYLCLLGALSDGNQIIIKTTFRNIQENVWISNQFLAYVGMAAVAVSALISIAASRKIAKPILELTEISKKMTDLDFNVKYEGNGNNEIDMLGSYMNQLSMTLERIISELKSANNELQSDIEKKIQVDEMRKEFLSNVSHELKTPLALIQGYAEGLKECVNGDEESREFYCDVIIDESDKMNQMVKKLLTLNQLEFGNDAIAMERFDLTELICGVIQSSSILLKQNGICLAFDAAHPMYVWADEIKVEEVVTNYLSNAIHHVQPPKKIEIKYTQMEGYVRVSIFNTGQQIPPEDIDKIWEKFYKVDKARTREYGGNGIGLSIVKAVMDSFHRECGVINYADGVEFWFELDTKNNC